jgi:hypothetical protein
VPNGRLNVCNIQIGPQSLRPLKTGYIYIEHRPLCPFCCVLCVSNQHTNISQLNKEETQNNKQQKAHLSYICVRIDYDDGGSYRRFITVDYRRPNRQERELYSFPSSSLAMIRTWRVSLRKKKTTQRVMFVFFFVYADEEDDRPR